MQPEALEQASMIRPGQHEITGDARRADDHPQGATRRGLWNLVRQTAKASCMPGGHWRQGTVWKAVNSEVVRLG